MSYLIWLGVAVDEAAEDVGKIGLGVDRLSFAVSISEAITASVDAALVRAGEQGVLAG